jgi:hypothetical protein
MIYLLLQRRFLNWFLVAKKYSIAVNEVAFETWSFTA